MKDWKKKDKNFSNGKVQLAVKENQRKEILFGILL
jgi:hypothetical protein